MPAYVVRLKANASNPRDFVGVFYAPDVEALAWLVDECTDVVACEYARLPAGGICRAGPAHPVPFRDEPDKKVDFLRGASFTENWFERFFSEEDTARWTSMGEPAWSSDEERQEMIIKAFAKLAEHDRARQQQ
ncbi:hypothetical protein FHS31_001208 [Sphingomonas vulcanisoli]|uniref:Uncharacterized protein n=1 Tax=Sphingomonas vulcanisoli TaxID=1658060 RepID=A0ABX0TPZ4_9SPHN|nr:hypothetical protein [Sphingomonas vulcanisoli]NIJ07612.1 hypothetical protein [Sphingomonas vulcanisoli]